MNCTTTSQQASSIKVGQYALLKGNPCKIIFVKSMIKNGKHGHAKTALIGNDIFTGKKYEDMTPASHNIEVPIVIQQTYQLVDISDDGFVSAMNSKTAELKEDLSLHEFEHADELQERFNNRDDGDDIIINTIQAMNKEIIVGFK